ncbi:hypothetical protein SMACR_02774 [Sordaria macrospora]|uniref:WGS project CABT00000000 data, contig 2.12 n=2 Tax=Sordaria macrospora TaxID=5147 RepID=F7VXF4_SORMK|nr:uncharacterized protein SMAC_02774 [Sordaria macrospora k-hell]KAA8634834.1 hypothetical protein SMACR_02774 [Sordaria macrospora]KAH7635118.1 hypothetical protein B0T09DRAFT_18043 [Sordaria sp. MPI-SDFR-AT-0083]WPJ58130.1 hypothetical protein SMAC4_02774 [Sordaria macrospora]CCC10196.1 unnamed protein product [Sordaria macrospora k-hell]
MTLPEPEVPLTNACAVVFENTLYTYSADAFQSLSLMPGAKWKKLDQGEKVTGGVCVGATTGTAATSSLFVVGGKGQTEGYQGIQKYSYSTKKWESIQLPAPVTQNRLLHGAVYLNATDSIIVYAGNQDGSTGPSTQTYAIGASAPHYVRSFEANVPPAINPILLPWSDSEAVMVGGSTSNTQVMLFKPETGWRDSGATLAAPIAKDTSAIKAALVRGDDGSQHLFTFDMTQSPNVVQRILLTTGPEQPIQNAGPAKKRDVTTQEDEQSPSGKRDVLNVLTWPQYNATLAPTSTRSNYAIAQDGNGMVVFVGGNSEEPLGMFNAKGNSWYNATDMLVEKKVKVLDITSSTISESSTATSTTALQTTSTSLATSEAPTTLVTATGTLTTASSVSPVSVATAAVSSSAEGPKDFSSNTHIILAAVLSSIFGLAIVLFAIYFCIKRKGKQQARNQAGRARSGSEGSGGSAYNEKSDYGFPPDTKGPFRGQGHQAQDSYGSLSSLAMIGGRGNQQKPGRSSPGHKLSISTAFGKRNSDDSTFKAFKSTISKPIPVSQTISAEPPQNPFLAPHERENKEVSFAPTPAQPMPRNPAAAATVDPETRRSSGWNRYWSGGSALNVIGLGNNTNSAVVNQVSQRTTVVSDVSSHYSEHPQHRMTQDSATVPPLQVYEPRMSINRVNSGSPTIRQHNHHDEKLYEGMSGQIEMPRPVSGVSSISGYSSGIPASVHDTWDPTEFTKPWGADRAPSSAYSASIYTTPLAPAGGRAPSQLAHQQSQQGPPRPGQQQIVRDDISWLNLGDQNGR